MTIYPSELEAEMEINEAFQEIDRALRVENGDRWILMPMTETRIRSALRSLRDRVAERARSRADDE